MAKRYFVRGVKGHYSVSGSGTLYYSNGSHEDLGMCIGSADSTSLPKEWFGKMISRSNVGMLENYFKERVTNVGDVLVAQKNGHYFISAPIREIEDEESSRVVRSLEENG